MLPLITIITVCRNPGVSIHKTFQSVIQQSYQNIKYIIIDGLSSDGTLEWLNRPEQRKHISLLISEPDSGIYDAINKGISYVNGGVIGILHAGDSFYNNNIIELVVNKFLNSQFKLEVLCGGLCFVHSKEMREEPLYPSLESVGNLKYKMSLFHPSVFISSEAYLNYGMYDSAYKIAGDFELLRRFYLAKAKIEITQICFVFMEYGGISTQLKNVAIVARECANIVHGNEPSLKKFIYSSIHIVFALISISKKRIKNIKRYYD